MRPGRLIALLVLASAVYLSGKLVPPYVHDYQVANVFDDEARRAHMLTDEEIRGQIVRKVKDLGLSDYVAAENIVIRRDAGQATISVSAEYDVQVELLGGRVVTLHFAPEVDRAIRRE